MQYGEDDTMETRKLVKSGLSSHVIAIPKEFLAENKLKTGDTLFLERQGKRTILVSAATPQSSDKKLKVKTIDVDGRPLRHVERDIIEAYLKSYNEIIVNLDSPSQAMEIKKYIGYLVAMEVVQEDNRQVVAKDFLNYNDINVERAIRRIEHIVGSMIADLKEVERDPELAKVIVERDYDVNRMGYLVMRVMQVAMSDPSVAETLKIDPLRIIQLWSINIHLEKIGDETKRLGKKVAQYGIRHNKRLFYEIHGRIYRTYEDTLGAFHGSDRKLLDKNPDERVRIKAMIEQYNKNNGSIPMAEMMGLFQQMVSHLADINRSTRYVGE
ncbi:TPA: phosphate uptake regulator PhoU [Candidatus Woesearchaeota archaeon]|nr:phosphate uptake regulator PhoU [Candidatus Woesearchaeota archaeon]